MDRMKILVVDDESRMRKLVSDFLTRKGYEVIEAADGIEAVDIFMENKDMNITFFGTLSNNIFRYTVTRQITFVDFETT